MKSSTTSQLKGTLPGVKGELKKKVGRVRKNPKPGGKIHRKISEIEKLFAE